MMFSYQNDNAYMRSIMKKFPEQIVLIEETRKISGVALRGLAIRKNIDKTLGNLYRKKADAMVRFDEESLLKIISEIQLLENVLDGQEDE